MAEPIITQEYVRSLFHYDAETGSLVWKARPREHFTTDRSWNSTNARMAGREAGARLNSDGYREVGIDGRLYKKHRIVWFYVTGQWPVEIDHENGDRSSSRFADIRNVSRPENMKNKAMRRDNTSGVVGVGWHAKDQRWVAHIKVEGKTTRLGAFMSKQEAAAARQAAERKLGFHVNHGRKPTDG